jgi:hypothetical protein
MNQVKIARLIFDEYGIYVKTTTVKRYIGKSHGRDLNTGPPAYKAGALPG